MNKVTIKDIAKEASVSPTAVSFVLNGKTNAVSKNTCNKILRVCKKHNYHPDYIAASLKRKHTYTVGCLVPDINNEYYSRLLTELNIMLHDKGYLLLISNTGYDIKDSIDRFHDIIDRNVDYLLIIPSSTLLEDKKELNNLIASITIPFVILDRKTGCKDCSEVFTNDINGGYISTKYLLDKGHTNIAIITGPKGVSSSDERLLGYKKALEEYGIPFEPSLVYEGNYRFESGLISANHIIEEKKVTAIFACNDLMAYGVYKALNNHNIRIPNDISVVGYDDNLFSSLISPGLTSVRQNITEICRSVIDQLFAEEDSKSTSIIEPKLVERESVKQI